MRKAAFCVLFCASTVMAQSLTPAMIEVRGERAKFVDCAKGYAFDHAAEFKDANSFFTLAMMTACNSYLERYVNTTRSALPDLHPDGHDQEQAMINIAIAGAIDEANAAAAKELREAHALAKK